jgi:hypothetical protein
MAERKERSIEGALWKQDNEGNNRPVYKGNITVKDDHVTDIPMGAADLKVLVAKIEKEGMFVLPKGLKLSMAFWNNKNGNPSAPALDGPVDNPYKGNTGSTTSTVAANDVNNDDVPF